MLSVLLEVLPWLAGTVAGGKAKEVATIGAKVAKEVFGTDDPTVVEAEIKNPQQLEAFKARLEQETAHMKAELEDVQDARRQTVALAQAGSALSWAPVVVSSLVVIGFLALTIGLLFKAVPDSQVAMVLYGALSAGFTQVLNYWLGSSAGSKRSGDAVRAIAEQGSAVSQVAKQIIKAVK